MTAPHNDKAAIVTGASMGIGYACAKRLQQDGFCLVICSRSQDDIEEAANQISSEPGRVVGIEADIRKRGDCEAIVQRCIDEFGRVDAVVNNAGIYLPCPFLDFTADRWDETLAINLRGPVLVSAAAGRTMRDQGGGRIVHIASINGLCAEPEFAHYNSAKAALVSLTRRPWQSTWLSTIS
jgi:NAD(P)-dependent dehydrogenase (short-subunit alcohol dehydrogenase family)